MRGQGGNFGLAVCHVWRKRGELSQKQSGFFKIAHFLEKIPFLQRFRKYDILENFGLVYVGGDESGRTVRSSEITHRTMSRVVREVDYGLSREGGTRWSTQIPAEALPYARLALKRTKFPKV